MLFKRIISLFSLAMLCTLSSITFSMYPIDNEVDIGIVKIEEDLYGNFHINFNKSTPKITTTQSFSHYDHPELQDYLINKYTVRNKIRAVGKKTVEKIMNEALAKEVAHAPSHYVFYHGCSIDFLLFQDILKLLTQIFTKRSLRNFFLLRIPTPSFALHKSAQDFLTASHYIVDDSNDPARRLLLSVNPSFLGNNINRETSSAFCYFLESKTAFSINSFNLFSEIFDFYNVQYLYHKYATELQELYATLTSYESTQTGMLMQIFIPKDLVNTITYRSLPRGVPYYGQYDYSAKLPQVELESYQQNCLPHTPSSGMLLDGMQFRILLSLEDMLNSANSEKSSSIIMFRHFNRSAKIKTYKKKVKDLFHRIKEDLKYI